MVPPRSFVDDYDFLSPVSSTRKLLPDISARLDFPTLSLALPPSSSSRQTHFTLLFLGSESGATLRYCANIDASPDGNGIVEGKVVEEHARGTVVEDRFLRLPYFFLGYTESVTKIFLPIDSFDASKETIL